MSEVFITRKGGGGKASAPELLITEVGASWIEFEVTNNDQVQSAQIFLLANYDTNSTEDFDFLAIQNGKVITVAAGATATELFQGLDPATTHTISAQASVIKKLPSNIVTTDPTSLLQTGLLAPTIGTLVEVTDTTLNVPLTNNETKIPLTIRVAVTTSTAIPTNYPLSESIGALSTTSVTVSGLTPLTVYYIHARAFDGDIQSANVTFGPYTKQEVPLYAFSNWTFTNAGQTGTTGPNITQVRSAYSSQTWAQNNDYLSMTTQGYQRWTVPQSGTYRIDCRGASGGAQGVGGAGGGGFGAQMIGNFSFSKGSFVTVVVGQFGDLGCCANQGAAGGGGSFVFNSGSTFSTSTVLIAAGGGGGMVLTRTANTNASTSTTGKNAVNGIQSGFGAGGTNGNGGTGGTSSGGHGGAGISTDGGTTGGGSGISLPVRISSTGIGGNLLYGGLGGFGGGGGYHGGGGGGGGYSGGGGGNWSNGNEAGGGGSINNGTNQANSILTATGHGQVIITKL